MQAVTSYHSVLILNTLRMAIHLGVGEDERRVKQDIALELRLYFPMPPAAAESDRAEASDYVCYHSLSEKIHALCTAKPYRLIEFLAHEAYRMARAEVSGETKIWIRVNKIKILLDYVEDGTSYIHTDLPAGAWVPPQ